VIIPPLLAPNNPVGDIHKRHRRAMAPAFGLVEAKGLVPYFMGTVTKVCELCLHLTLKVDQPNPSSDGRQVE